MPPIKGSFRIYSEEALKAAIEDVKEHNLPIRTVARKFGIPRTTLKYKVEGKLPMERIMGPVSILSRKEEDEMCRWIREMVAAGFQITPDHLVRSVQSFVKKLKRPNAFKNGRPGSAWLKGFLRRNSTVSKNICKKPNSRISVTNTDLRNWFDRVCNYLKERGSESVLNEPSRIFVSGEAVLSLNPKCSRVLRKKGSKPARQEDYLSVMLTCNAGGLVAPTVVSYRCMRPPQEIVDSFPKEWSIGKSDSGWMNCETFFDFIANVFHPWLTKTGVSLPVVLFIDGHHSNLSFETCQFCEEKGIILLGLCPGVSHLLQPVFPSLKESWRKRIYQWRLENPNVPIMKKKDFAKFLKEVIDNTLSESVLSDGFRNCGLYPWNPLAVKTPEEEKGIEIGKLINYLRQGLQFLNENIELEKLTAFRCSPEEWTGDPQDTSLFTLWKKTQIELEKLYNLTENSGSDEKGKSPEDEDDLNEEFPNKTFISKNDSPSPEPHENDTSDSDDDDDDDDPSTWGSNAVEPNFDDSDAIDENKVKKEVIEENLLFYPEDCIKEENEML